MKYQAKDQGRERRKAYARLRMVRALGRAIEAQTPREKDRAARWVAAWGLVSGIHSQGIRLRRSTLYDPSRNRRKT